MYERVTGAEKSRWLASQLDQALLRLYQRRNFAMAVSGVMFSLIEAKPGRRRSGRQRRRDRGFAEEGPQEFCEI